jgi:hypothetical protein
VAEDARAQVEREALADPGRDVLVAEREQRPQQREPDHDGGEDGERPERLGDEDVVDDELEQPDLCGLDGGQQRGEQDPGREPAAVGPHERPEAPHDVRDGDGRRRGDEAGVVRGGSEGGGESVEEGAHLRTSEARAGTEAGPGVAERACGSGVRAPAAVAATPAAALAPALAGVAAVAVPRGEASGGGDALERTMSHGASLSWRVGLDALSDRGGR